MNAPIGTTPELDLAARLTASLERLRSAQAAQEPSFQQRRDDLQRLRTAFQRDLPRMVEAIAADFGRRSRHETLLSDGMTVLHDIDYALANLQRWMRPRRAAVDWRFQPGRAEVRPRPLGVVGIISPWNYPVNLALMPLTGAIAAGNHVMLKPSELTPQSSEFLRELLAEVFPEDRVTTVEGGPDVAAAFSALPFDHLFFTGSTQVGRLVMAAAAPNLTPVTLELGGKSPTVIAPGFPIAQAARRIVAGKCLNAGQTCIAPDYVLVPRSEQQALVAALKDCVTQNYADILASPDYTSICTDRHFSRLQRLLDAAQAGGAELHPLSASSADPKTRVFPPVAVTNADATLELMQDEIFGPILPIVAYDDLPQAQAYINARPRPLALYLFDHDRARVDRFLDGVVAGGVTVNDTLLHIAQDSLPFGGVGPSGMGSYHGEQSFQTFSKFMPVFRQARFSALWWLGPPYRGFADRLLGFLTR